LKNKHLLNFEANKSYNTLLFLLEDCEGIRHQVVFPLDKEFVLKEVALGFDSLIVNR